MTEYAVMASRLNLRAQPQVGEVLAVLPRGQVLSAVGASAVANWLEVRTMLPQSHDELQGFVATDYLQAVGVAPPPAPAAAPALPTLAQMHELVGRTGRDDILAAVVDGLATVGREAGLFDAPLRLAHFLAQAAHESAGFHTTVEYWGPTPAQSGYEGRKDLGNTQPGDGKRYMGRGLFQLTGRSNYELYGRQLNLDLVGAPERAADPATSFRIACQFWNLRKLSDYADRDDLEGITRRINGGYNGLEARRQYYQRARKLWG